jgi:hypothetical protein
MVGGSFNDWQLVSMKASRTSYVIIIELPVGEHQVKLALQWKSNGFTNDSK